jgi:hypothetical protein
VGEIPEYLIAIVATNEGNEFFESLFAQISFSRCFAHRFKLDSQLFRLGSRENPKNAGVVGFFASLEDNND